MKKDKKVVKWEHFVFNTIDEERNYIYKNRVEFYDEIGHFLSLIPKEDVISVIGNGDVNTWVESGLRGHSEGSVTVFYWEDPDIETVYEEN